MPLMQYIIAEMASTLMPDDIGIVVVVGKAEGDEGCYFDVVAPTPSRFDDCIQ